MSDIRVGDVFERPYPFYDAVKDEGSCAGEMFIPGCRVIKETEDWGWGDVEVACFFADYVGEIVMEVISIAELPGRYVDRVFYRKSYKNSDGERHSKATLEVATITKFKKWIDSDGSPFPREYEMADD